MGDLLDVFGPIYYVLVCLQVLHILYLRVIYYHLIFVDRFQKILQFQVVFQLVETLKSAHIIRQDFYDLLIYDNLRAFWVFSGWN